MAELLSSGSNRKEKAVGRWLLTRPVEDGGLRQGSSASWIKRGRRNSGAVVLCSQASSGEAKGIHGRVELLLRVRGKNRGDRGRSCKDGAAQVGVELGRRRGNWSGWKFEGGFWIGEEPEVGGDKRGVAAAARRMGQDP